MQKVFTNGNERDGREIMIEIKEGVAEFFFNEYYRNHIKWLAEQEESGEIEYLDEDAKVNNGFYWIGTEDWNARKEQWKEHLSHKVWFTDEMYNYLDKNL